MCLNSFKTSGHFSQLSKMVVCNLLMLGLRLIVKGFSIFLPNTITISLFFIVLHYYQFDLITRILIFKTVSIVCCIGFCIVHFEDHVSLAQSRIPCRGIPIDAGDKNAVISFPRGYS